MSPLSLANKTNARRRPLAADLIVAATAAFALLAMSLPQAEAAFTYTDFNSTAGLTLNGTAGNMGSSILIVTPNGLSQAGSFWHTTKEAVGTFTTTFDFAITDKNGLGADGFAFVIQNSSVNALGGTGGAMGYADNLRFGGTPGITNSIAIEFDLWNNQPDWDDFNNSAHISVQSNGLGTNRPSEAFSLGQTAIPTDFVDGDLHSVQISYSGSSIDIFLDDFLTPILSVAVDLTALLNLDAGNEAWVGFTAATGAFQNSQQHEIRSWAFAGAAPTPGVGMTIAAGGLLAGARRRRR